MSRPTPSRADLSRLLEGGADIEELLFDALPTPERDAVMGCAAVRDFDEAMYQEVLRPPGGPELEQLVGSGHVEASGTPGRFWVAGPFADVGYLAYWRDEGRPAMVSAPVPDRLAEVARRSADWLEGRAGAAARIDVLLQCDLQQAGELLEASFAAADAAHDLAACHDLLDAVERRDRVPLYVGTEVAELHQRCRARLAARTRWASEYSSSAQYFPRPYLERRFDALLSPSGPRVLQLFARGGMGKSMQLRWFVGRRCAAGPVQVPCAGVDFDNEDPSRATRNPWLVALRVAEQLEAQLVSDHFGAILDSFGSRIPLLYADRRGGPTTPFLPDDVDGPDVVGRISAVLAERPGDQPVVVVVDTCEELLRAGVEPGGLLAMLGDLVDQAPALRLVLSGRYDLRTSQTLRRQGVDVAALFPAMDTCRVRSFGEADRRRYLVETRKVPDGELVEAIVARTGRSPFLLAAFADLARLEPDLTAEEVRRREDPGLLYLIEKILKRVEADVRWLLLYGVVPRRLSFGFLRDVMRPLLVEGMTRLAEQSSARDRLPLSPAAPPEDDEQLADLWQRMLGYAGRYSWVWVESGELRFHPDVLDPLRAVARREEFFVPLHEAAVEHFSALAGSDEDRWAEWTAEALYHRFQLAGPSAAQDWHDALARARARGDDEAVHAIAREPLRREYLDEDDNPRPFRRGVPLVTWDLVVAAHVQLALADADRADRASPAVVRGYSLPASTSPSASSAWVEVSRHIAAARELATRHDVPLPQPETALVESRLALATGRVREAAELLGRVVVGHPGGLLGPLLELTSRVVRQLLGDDDAWSGFEESWRSAEEAQQPRVGLKVALGRAAAAVEHGRLDTALEWLDRAAELERPDEQARRVALHAEALTAAGAPSAAVELLRHRGDPQSGVTRVRAELAADRPREALAAADLAKAVVLADVDAELYGALCRLRSAANADLLRVDEALADLQLAKATARSFHDPDAEALAAAQLGLLHLRQIGDLRNAAACVEEAFDAATQDGSAGRLAAVVARAELQMWQGDLREARRTVEQARRAFDAPAAGVRLEIAALMVADPDDAVPLVRLADRLEQLHPPAARVILLEDLALVPRRHVPAGVTERLRSAAAPGADVSGPDGAGLAWRLAELERLLGDSTAARRRLVEQVLPRAEDNPFLWWRTLEGLHRCGKAGEGEPALPEDPFASDDHDPGLRAAWLVRIVQWRGHLESPDWCRRRLDLAESMLQRPRNLPTRWRAHLDETRAKVDEREGSPDAARRAAATASATWARLGQPRRQARIAETYELGGAVASADTDLQLELWTDDEAPTRPVVHTRLSTPPSGVTELAVDSSRLLAATADSGSTSLVRHVRVASARLSKGWTAWATEAGDCLGEHPGAAGLADPAADLRLVIWSPRLAALPWELAMLPAARDRTLPQLLSPRVVYRSVERRQRFEHEVTAAQAALQRLDYFEARADGLMGRATRAAVERFQHEHGLEPTGTLDPSLWQELRARISAAARERPLRVLVVAPPAGPGVGDLSGGPELTALYATRGADVRGVGLPELARPGRGRPEVTEWRPDVVHILASVDIVGGNVVVETGHGTQRGRLTGYGLEQLSVTALGDFLAAMASSGFGPAVVVETPWRPTRTESARALLLRNMLAYSLVGLGRIESILCTGGAPPADRKGSREALVGALVSGANLADVGRRVQTCSPEEDRLDRLLAHAGSALFLQRSPQTLFEVGAG